MNLSSGSAEGHRPNLRRQTRNNREGGLGTIERGVPHRGYRKNAFVDARQAQRCVQGACSGFPIFDCRNKEFSFDTYPSCLDTSRIRINVRLRCVWKRLARGAPLRGTPLTIFPADQTRKADFRRKLQMQMMAESSLSWGSKNLGCVQGTAENNRVFTENPPMLAGDSSVLQIHWNSTPALKTDYLSEKPVAVVNQKMDFAKTLFCLFFQGFLST